VTVLALLFWLGAVVCGALGILALIGPALVSALLQVLTPGPAAGPGLVERLGEALPFSLLFIAGVAALLGHGMWTVRRWARNVTVAVAAMSLLAILPGLHEFASHPRMSALGTHLLRVGGASVVVGYLSSRRIRDAFGTAGLLRA
jgi:hypothetical protein